MKILILNASPRRRGNISAMLQTMQEEAEKQGYEVTLVRVNDLNVAPCTGCMSCRTTLKCVLPDDDAQRVAGLIAATDALIIGAPCYWGNIPGQLKLLFDRIVYAMMGESAMGIPKPLHKGKRAIVVSTCTTPFPFNILFHQTSGVRRALKEILGYSGFKITATIQKGGTKAHSGITQRETARCKRAVSRL